MQPPIECNFIFIDSGADGVVVQRPFVFTNYIEFPRGTANKGTVQLQHNPHRALIEFIVCKIRPGEQR